MSYGAFDLVVVGGGITGAAAARDAALRGLSTALFEKGDFSSGTTAKTSRLIHGGLRYLEGFHVGLVRECLGERDWVFARLSHLLKAIPILLPVYRGDSRGMTMVWAGMKIYDLLARRKATPHYGTVSAGDAMRRAPGIRREGLLGAAVFYDYQLLIPERLVVENLLSAAGAGARVCNHAEIEAVSFGDGLFHLFLRDRVAGGGERVSARVVINATGPWADRMRRLAGLPGEILSPTKGAHIVLPADVSHALFAASPADHRLLFLLPLDGRLLVGTTDTPFDLDPGTAEPSPEDIAYLLEGASRVLPGTSLSAAAPLYAYAGVRPLLKASGPAGSHTSRE
ncbi:MAG TPA: FAD-dependent oxidoreductase, partial [Candidatus Deferrimicrobium sp.]